MNLDELIPYYHAALYRCQIHASATGYYDSDTVSSGKISGKELADGYATPFTLGGIVTLSSDTGEFTPGATVTESCTGGTFDEVSAAELRYVWEVRSAPGESENIIPGANQDTYTIEDQYDGQQFRIVVTSETRNGTVYSDWYPMPIDPNTHFVAQPNSGAAKKSEEYSFSWELSGPVKAIVLQVWYPEDNDWASRQSISGNTSSVTFSPLLAEGNVSRYRLLVGLGGSHFYSDEFTVTWTDDESSSTVFITQPQSGTAKQNEEYTFSWELSGSVDEVVLYRWIPGISEWGAGSSLTGNSGSVQYQASMCEGNVSKYKLYVKPSDGSDFYSDEFTVTWTEDEPSVISFTKQPQSGTAKQSENYSFSWELSGSVDEVVLYRWIPGISEWGAGSSLTGNSGSVQYQASMCEGNVSKYKLYVKPSDGSDFYSDEFTVTWTEDSTEQPNPFTDVSKSDSYYDAVIWAYYAEPQITDGMTDTTFGPELTVTRGQCVTFLWRAMGKPEPSGGKNPFTDVPADQYYYKAMLWAVEKGITDGVTDTTFEPDTTLSTQHIITFLYRTLNPGKDGWSGEAAAWAGKDDGGKPFGVDIAVDNKTDCPRWCVVQFLYKTVK